MLWIYAVLGLIFGGLISFILLERKVSKLRIKLLKLDELDKTVENLNQSLVKEVTKNEVTTKELAEITTNVAVLNKTLDDKITENNLLTQKLEKEQQNSLKFNQINLEQSQTIARLTNQLENDAKRLEDLKEAKENLSQQFKVVAQEVLEQKSKQHKDTLDTLLAPFKDQVKGFSEKIEKYHMQGKADQAALKSALATEVKNMMELSHKMKSEADNLAKALKGDKKVQGNWGELVLERVLETSGLRQGVEYTLQKTLKNDEHQIYRPDVIVHLPEGKDVIIDSKVSLVAYERYTRSLDEIEASQNLKQHIQSIRNHITQLSNKEYQQLSGVTSLDFVLLFIPIESAFVLAFQNDEHLFSDAFNKRIIVVTPTTLLATLRTIQNIWRYENQNKNAQDIADRAKRMLDKFRGFVEDLDKLGDQLARVKETHEKAMNKLSKGNGNLINQADRLIKLGVPMNKQLPKGLLDQAELNDD
ncbi:DNA recombination protein RmuC [Thiotrichales bacterium 19S3-7]|nr:DNA recombination protein RmuC [Thiotrichales bacterium 19S3-7]MCF6801490.1 DNA recombination protein RmuC [Thiotrichales bacterium 19S3-11]